MAFRLVRKLPWLNDRKWVHWYKVLFFLAALLQLSQGVFGELISEEYLKTFLLPISGSSSGRISLSVNIPKGYISLQPTSSWSEAPMIEFIPQGQTESTWTEIITLYKIMGQKIQSNTVTDYLKNNILTKGTHGVVWQDKSSESSHYLKAVLGVMAEFKGNLEVIGCQYYSGAQDCVGVQYTVRSSKEQMSEEMVKQAIEKIENFFTLNTQVINSF